MRKLVFIFILSFFTLFTTHTYATPVYVAKDSRVYHHDRNCSNLNTTNGLMEFGSPQKAVASGGILCEHCDPSAFEETVTPSYQLTKVKTQRDEKEKKKEDTKESLIKDKPSYDLENLAVKIEDLPLGFKLKSALHIGNKSEAGSQGMMTDSPDEWIDRFREWGRIDGYTVIFTRGNEQVFSSNEIFVSKRGASKAFRKMTENYQPEQFQKDAAEREDSRILRFEARKISTIGDESIMLSKNVKASRAPFTFVSMVIISWRRDKTLHKIMFMSIGSAIFDSNVVKLAKVQDERIKQRQEKNVK